MKKITFSGIHRRISRGKKKAGNKILPHTRLECFSFFRFEFLILTRTDTFFHSLARMCKTIAMCRWYWNEEERMKNWEGRGESKCKNFFCTWFEGTGRWQFALEITQFWFRFRVFLFCFFSFSVWSNDFVIGGMTKQKLQRRKVQGGRDFTGKTVRKIGDGVCLKKDFGEDGCVSK